MKKVTIEISQQHALNIFWVVLYIALLIISTPHLLARHEDCWWPGIAIILWGIGGLGLFVLFTGLVIAIYEDDIELFKPFSFTIRTPGRDARREELEMKIGRACIANDEKLELRLREQLQRYDEHGY